MHLKKWHKHWRCIRAKWRCYKVNYGGQ
jgi:hypothetical protein